MVSNITGTNNGQSLSDNAVTSKVKSVWTNIQAGLLPQVSTGYALAA